MKLLHCLHKYGFAVICAILLLIIYVTHSNQSLFYLINAWHVLLPNEVWLTINMLAYSRFFILPIVLLLLTLWKRRDLLINVVIVIIAYYLVFAGLKHLLAHPRPYVTLDHHTFFWLNRFENTVASAHRSFPSGHVGNMAVFVFSLYHLFFEKKPWAQVILIVILLLTMMARICTGWHWPMDVLASVAIGFILVQWCFSFSVQRRR